MCVYQISCGLSEHERVKMSNLSTKRLCEIDVGDEVLTPYGSKKVTAIYNKGVHSCYRLVWNGGVVTKASANQRFLFCNPVTNQEEWKSVEQVIHLYEQNTGFLDAVRITPRGKHNRFKLFGISEFRPCVMYDMNVEDVHCFVLANGVVSSS